MKPYFRKNQFVLCDVPVPEGYPQAQTHSGAFYHKGIYYLVTTPYPFVKSKLVFSIIGILGNNRLSHLIELLFWKTEITRQKKLLRRRADLYENPCLYIGKNQLINEYGGATIFKPVMPFPLIEAPEQKFETTAYNSDVDICIHDEEVYILNRPRVEKKNETAKETLDLIKGKLDNGTITITSISKSFSTFSGGCPCLCFYKGEFVLFKLRAMGSLLTGKFNPNGKLSYIKIPKVDLISSNDQWENVEVRYPNHYYPWHISVFTYNETIYSIVTCIKEGYKHLCWNFLGEFSSDLSRLVVYKQPLSNYSSYRSGACVREDGEFILYNTTVGERIKGGRSIGGREILMAHCSFDELLKKLRSAE